MKNKSAINLEVSLIEIILSVFIFAIAGVIMLNCFAIAKFTQQKSNDKTNASTIVQSSLEYMKSANDYNKLNQLLKNNFSYETVDEKNDGTTYLIFFDDEFKECTEENHEFVMKINLKNISNPSGDLCDINVFMEKREKYPFIKNEDKLIYSISSKKFFPIYTGRGINE